MCSHQDGRDIDVGGQEFEENISLSRAHLINITFEYCRRMQRCVLVCRRRETFVQVKSNPISLFVSFLQDPMSAAEKGQPKVVSLLLSNCFRRHRLNADKNSSNPSAFVLFESNLCQCCLSFPHKFLGWKYVYICLNFEVIAYRNQIKPVHLILVWKQRQENMARYRLSAEQAYLQVFCGGNVSCFDMKSHLSRESWCRRISDLLTVTYCL